MMEVPPGGVDASSALSPAAVRRSKVALPVKPVPPWTVISPLSCAT
jgi:hypothetical protein